VISAIERELADHVAAIRETVARSSVVIADIVDRVCACFDGGGKVLVCGNGGSAADAQHFAAEFMNRMRLDRQPWPAIALATDTSVLTSIANDATYEEIFSRQVEALGRPGDVLFGLSTSGNSTNVLSALKTGRRLGLVTVGFTGQSGADRLGADCDLVLAVPSPDTARIQECHEFVYHFIAGAVENRLLGRADIATNPKKEDGQ
jgi:D-sedoheptulose 7-phosphate isomerase